MNNKTSPFNKYAVHLKYFCICILFIVMGLFIRSSFIEIPQLIHPYVGDVIWGGMLYFFISSFGPNKSFRFKIITTTIISYAIEFSQLIKAEWLEYLRQFYLVSLVIGHGFKFSDFICYSAGIFLGFVLDYTFLRR